MYDKMEAVKNLNHVEGFHPKSLMRTIEKENQKNQSYLDVQYRKLWFRLKHEQGKITKKIVTFTEQFAIVEARVYLDRNDLEDNYISNAFAQRHFTKDNEFGKKYLESAETAAIGRALADAGFGGQFCDMEGELDLLQVDAGIVVENTKMPTDKKTKSKETTNSISKKEPIDQGITTNKNTDESYKTSLNITMETPIAPEIPKPRKISYTESTPIEEICKEMTLEEAKEMIIKIGFHKGKTMGAAAQEKPDSLKWYIDQYKGPDNILRASARILLSAAIGNPV